MKILLVMIYIFGPIVISNTLPKKRKRTFAETYKFDCRLGIPIASSTQIQQYEKEHTIMYRKENGTMNESKYREWPSKLVKKNVTEYCKKYLQAIIPKRNIVNMFGEPKVVQLLYSYDDDGIHHPIGAIKCEIPGGKPYISPRGYYITEAPDQDCVYTLMRNTRSSSSPFKIMFRVCGFETNDAPSSIYFNIKPEERKKRIIKVHRKTGIPIATESSINEYETKHQGMHKTEDGHIATDKYIAWPSEKNKSYLTNFCSKFLEATVPNRLNKGLYGKLGELVLYYTQNNLIPLRIGIIKCVLPAVNGIRKAQLQYYITESPEPNCVYTILCVRTFPHCRIVYQICGIKINQAVKGCMAPNPNNPPLEVVNDGETKPDLNIIGNTNIYNLPTGGAKELEIKAELKTFSIFPED